MLDSLTEVFKRMEVNESSKPINLKDLKTEVNDLKLEIKKLIKTQASQDRKMINLNYQITSLSQLIKDDKDKDIIVQNSLKEEEKDESFPHLLMINQVPYQK